MVSTISFDGGNLVYTADDLFNMDYNEKFVEELRSTLEFSENATDEGVADLIQRIAQFMKRVDQMGLSKDFWVK